MIGDLYKYALDAEDQRTIRQLKGIGRFGRKLMGPMSVGAKFLRGVGRVGMGLGKATAAGAQWLGDTVVNHPTRSLVIGAPLAAGLYSFGDRFDRAQNNVNPNKTYQY